MNSEATPVRILAVDDRSENLLALEVALRGTGYELVTALSGCEAAELAKADNYAAILLDVQRRACRGRPR